MHTDHEVIDMASKIEDIIEEIQEYIDNCKYKKLSNEIILVDKEEIEQLLGELRAKTPEEIRIYQKIVRNKEAIIAAAEEKAQEIINQAQAYTNDMISESEVVQQAYVESREIIEQASNQAEGILSRAYEEAEAIRSAAMQYTDDSLATIQSILSSAIETQIARGDKLVQSLQQCLHVVNANRAELHPGSEDEAIAERSEAQKISVENTSTDLLG